MNCGSRQGRCVYEKWISDALPGITVVSSLLFVVVAIFVVVSVLLEPEYPQQTEIRDPLAGDAGVVEVLLPNQRLEIPVEYFYGEYVRVGTWSPKKSVKIEGVTIWVTMKGFEPYSEKTKEIFEAYAEGEGWGKVLRVYMHEHRKTMRSNREYYEYKLRDRRRIESEYEGLEKYVDSPPFDCTYYLKGEDSEMTNYYVCRSSPNPLCTATSCKDGLCLDYQFPAKEMQRWELMHTQAWEIINTFKSSSVLSPVVTETEENKNGIL